MTDHSADLYRVLSRIQQDVRNRVADFARGSKHLQVIAVAQDLPSSAGDAVHRSRKPRTERLHSAREISRTRRLDDQVRVIPLVRVVNDTESPPFTSLAERALELADETNGAKRRNVAPDSQRDMARVTRGERRSKHMRVAAKQPRLAARTVTAPAPSRRGSERKRELSRAASHRQNRHTDE